MHDGVELSVTIFETELRLIQILMEFLKVRPEEKNRGKGRETFVSQ